MTSQLDRLLESIHPTRTLDETARTGNEGGLYGVLKKVAQTMAEQYADNEIAAKVHTYYGDLSIEEQLAVADQYLRKYGHLLPSELTEGSGARLKANFPRVWLIP